MKSAQWDTQHGKRSFRFWFYLGLAATLLVWTSAADAGDVTVTDADGSPWTITISPGPVTNAVASDRLVPPLPAATAAQDELASAGAVDPAMLTPVAVGAVQDDDADHGITIQPLGTELFVNGRSYTDVYNAIPYSKTEYYANPSYRHDTTMEILFGQLRPGPGGRTQGRIIENPVYGPYRPYLFAHWDWFQTSTLLHPRYYRPLYGGILWPGYMAY